MESKPMSDSQINELLATKVMKPREIIRIGDRVRCYFGFMLDPCDFNPCHDYNHLRQVEEALSEEQKDKYADAVLDLTARVTTPYIQTAQVIIYATARQRCEAIAKVVGGE